MFMKSHFLVSVIESQLDMQLYLQTNQREDPIMRSSQTFHLNACAVYLAYRLYLVM